jgi:hypothetical protein
MRQMRQIHRQVGGAVGHCGTEERLHLCCGEDRQAMGALHWQMGGRASFLQYLARLIKIVYIVFGCIRVYYIPAVTLCYLALPCYLVRSGNKSFTEISIEYNRVFCCWSAITC